MADFLEKKNIAVPERDDSQTLSFYKFVLDSVPVAILTVNADLRITGFNPWAQEITGYSSEEVAGKYCGEILQGGMCSSHCPLRTVIGGHVPISLVESTIRNKWGETIPVRMNTAGLFDNSGNLIGGVESFQDISRLKALEREKNNLISMFAHDMKSSLTIIGGFVLRLLKKQRNNSPEKEKKYLTIAKNESARLEALVNEFLEFSRLQTGKIRLDLAATLLDKELLEMFDAYQLEASQHGIRLELENEEELPIIQADAIQLRRVFSNLLDNAIKFTQEGGAIWLETGKTKDEVFVQIRDEGIGIPSEELPFIFDPFHRGQAVRDKKGFGLGLAGVKAIVEAHGGHIRVSSEPLKGSVFTVVLPREDSKNIGGDMASRDN
ncbi:MAG: PAS domain S-box protein [Deltaproteobacteria bacterium]|nr:PAS domain S-box protein [Deltaproteobacteria bacterium]